jgi:hypothetical protein
LRADEGPQLLGVDLLANLREQHRELLDLVLTLSSSPQVSHSLQEE